MNRHPALAISHDDELLCPYCGEIYTHVESALVFKGSSQETDLAEHAILGLIGGIQEDEDRSRVTIRIRCEQGHRWLIHFQQHKGCTVVSHEVVR